MVLDRLRSGRKLVLIHGNADPDAFGSALAIKECFEPVDICAPEGLDRVSKLLARKFEYEPLVTADPTGYDTVIVVDTSSPEQLGGMNLRTSDWIIIDHHTRTDKWCDSTYICDDSRRSCTELIFDLIQESGAPMSKKAGLALLSGMLTDSGHFHYATPLLMRT
ncbi:MAG TPA: DHH family phosphoesterase, partial [Methanomassiliicoccales archaeon]|nr:DHH family phosphoesterase [Methanomassiliicoccales archaeon]